MAIDVSPKGSGAGVRVAAGLLLAAVIALHASTLTLHSMWNDEFITLDAIDLSYRNVIVERLRSNHAPGYFLMLKAWTGIVGRGEAALHFPSMVGALIGIVLVWRLGARLWGERLGILVLALAGLNQVHLQMGHFTRMYSLLFMADAWALLAMIEYLESGRRRGLVWLVLAGIFGLAMHMLYLLTTVTQVFYLIWRRNRLGPRVKGALLGVLLPLVFLLPQLIAWGRLQRKVGGSGEWLRFEIVDAFRTMFVLFTGDYHPLDFEPVQILGVILIVLCLAATVSSLRRRTPMEEPSRYDDLFWVWCMLPTLLIALGSLRSEDNLNALRYYVMVGAAAPVLMLGATMKVWRAGRRRWAVAGIGLMLAVIVTNTVGYLFWDGSGLRQVAGVIAADYRPDDAVIVSRKRNRSRAFVYYGPLAAEPPTLPDGSDEKEKLIAWMLETLGERTRFWAVFYQRLDKDPLRRGLTKADEFFEPVGEVAVFGETAVQLYRVAP
jgi:uncharacterized membrane protein